MGRARLKAIQGNERWFAGGGERERNNCGMEEERRGRKPSWGGVGCL